MQLIRPFFVTLYVLLLVGCADEPADDVSVVELPEPPPQPLPEVDSGCRLSGALYGAIEGSISWQADELRCEGMPRPGGEGARLRFAGPHPDGLGTLAVIVALPAHARGTLAESMSSRVTMIEEGGGRFFAASEAESCWVDVVDIASLDENRELTIGRLYCIRPLGEINGRSALTLPELEFSGLIDWSAS